LKGLLYQVILQCPHLIPSVWSSRWDAGNTFDISFDHWTRQELTDALVHIIACGSLKSKFCFFVDGLDEYADAYVGEHHAMIKFLDHLAQSSHVKLCVSSRPWNVFKDRYGERDDLKFILQDLTSEDMLRFAQDLLQDDERFQRLVSREPKALSLAVQIRDRAEGVFLWVFLVTRSLQSGLSDHDGIEELERRLAKTLSDLYEYYWSIFESIDDHYKDYTLRALQIAAIALPMPLAAFQYIPQEVEDHTYAIRQKLDVGIHATGRESQNGDSGSDLLNFFSPTASESDTEAKVNKWCRDLLEVQFNNEEWKSPHPSVLSGQVQFLHRTVKDFLLKQNMQDLFHQSSVCIPSPRKAVCRMYLAYTKSCCGIYEPDSPDKTFSLEVNTRKVLRWAKLCETYDHSTPLDLMNELEMIRLAVQIARSSHVDSLESMLRLAVKEDLLLYVEQIPNHVVRAEPGILWDALVSGRVGYTYGHHAANFKFSSQTSFAIGLEMIAKLLGKGCSPNDGFSSSNADRGSVWQALLRGLHQVDPVDSVPLPRHINHADRSKHLQYPRLVEATHVVAFLLKHGADPDVQVSREGQNEKIHARRILMKAFDNDDAKVDALQKEARKVRAAALSQERGFFAGLMGWTA
jgi:hypothetical protein